MALMADGGAGAVAGMDDGVIGELEEFGLNGIHNFVEEPPQRSVRPMLPAKSVSPAKVAAG